MTESRVLPRLTKTEFLARVDHTLLTPGVTAAELHVFLEAARTLGVRRVCVSPSLLPLESPDLEIVTVVGFPSGAHQPAVKAAEAAQAVADGAHEIDMVANRALIRAAAWGLLEAEIRAVRDACAGTPVKVILETATLDDMQIREACRAAQRGGADFVKTSTGFDAGGGATVAAVRLMTETVGDTLGVKASGGIRTPRDVHAMWEAGATRFGLSATANIIEHWEHDDVVSGSDEY